MPAQIEQSAFKSGKVALSNDGLRSLASNVYAPPPTFMYVKPLGRTRLRVEERLANTKLALYAASLQAAAKIQGLTEVVCIGTFEIGRTTVWGAHLIAYVDDKKYSFTLFCNMQQWFSLDRRQQEWEKGRLGNIMFLTLEIHGLHDEPAAAIVPVQDTVHKLRHCRGILALPSRTPLNASLLRGSLLGASQGHRRREPRVSCALLRFLWHLRLCLQVEAWVHAPLWLRARDT